MDIVPTSTSNRQMEIDVHHDTSGVAHVVEPPLPPHLVKEGSAPFNSQLKDPAVRDFGWNVPPSKITAPLMHGLSNDDIYTLIRRFNKQVFNVRAIPSPPPGVLDLEISENEEFSPDKLRATLERLYITVIVGLAAFAKHVARLRSWNEPRRTAGFCAGYYIAWILNALLPLVLTIIAALIVYPPARLYLFPPAPLSVISGTTGNLQKPKSGGVGSADSLSGAPEAHKGEAVEQEARHFVAGLSAIAVSTAVGKGPGDDGNGNAVGGGESEAEGKDKDATSIDDSVPSPTMMVTGAAESKHLASGDHAAVDPAKKPVQDAMWDKARPVMRALANVADTWERFGNAISPTHPFPNTTRVRSVAPLLPLILMTYTIPATFFLHTITFLLGFALFGQPLMNRGIYWLTHNVPNWREYLDLKRTLLKGVPTDAQLTLTLLRISERNKTPLPPPPTAADGPTPPTNDDEDPDDLQFDTSNYDVDTDSDQESVRTSTSAEYDRLSHNGSEPKSTSSDEKRGHKKKKNAGRRIAGIVKGAVKMSVESALGIDHVKASLGSDASKKRIGAISDPPLLVLRDDDPDQGVRDLKESNEAHAEPGPLEDGEGPCVFTARYLGKKGHIVLIESATSPCLAFVYNKPTKSWFRRTSREVDPRDLHPEFTVGLPDIIGLRKIGGFGWKAKMVVGWALGREVVDGLEVTESTGTKLVMTAVRGRDELFNRLIAMGEQRWETY